MFHPQHQGQQDPRVAAIDEASDLIILKLRTMSRAAAKDRLRYRQEVRDMLQTFVDEVMAFADELSL